MQWRGDRTMDDVIGQSLEPVEGPAWLEFEVRMPAQLGGGGSQVRITVVDVNTIQWNEKKDTHAAKHLNLRSSANDDSSMPAGTGGGCLVWYNCGKWIISYAVVNWSDELLT